MTLCAAILSASFRELAGAEHEGLIRRFEIRPSTIIRDRSK